MTVLKPRPRSLNPNPVQQTAAFTPPPTGVVTIRELAHGTFAYWSTIRLAWLSGYKIKWVIPGRGGAVSGSQSVWSLDNRVRPVEEIHPFRTAQYSLDPYVLVKGRPHIEPWMGTRVTVRASALSVVGDPVSARARAAPAPGALGETARWLPSVEYFDGQIWSPAVVPPSPDDTIEWESSEANAPTLSEEFEYARFGEWLAVPSLLLEETTYLRLNGMPLFSGDTPLPAVTMMYVVSAKPPVQYWGSFLRAVEADGTIPEEITNLDFRLMQDGNIHPFTRGWQYPLPLIGARHSLSLFGFTLDVATDYLRMFTMDQSLRFMETRLPYPHSKTSQFVLGRSAETLLNMDLLDVLMFRGEITVEQITEVCSTLDAAYGITAHLSQDQG